MTARGTLCTLLASSLATLLPAMPSTAAEPDLELGEYLAAECTGCHRADAIDAGIPAIFGMSRPVFLERMALYKNGTRNNPIMRNVAASLSDEELVALSAWLEQAGLQR